MSTKRDSVRRGLPLPAGVSSTMAAVSAARVPGLSPMSEPGPGRDGDDDLGADLDDDLSHVGTSPHVRVPPVEVRSRRKVGDTLGPPLLPQRPPPTRQSAPPGFVRATTAVVSSLVGGRYRIIERIGKGGMGKVYKVEHTQLGKVFALKIIGEDMADTEDARGLFVREARMASSLSHPNIASVLDFGQDDRVGAFMVMEFVDGEPLVKVLHEQGRMSPRQACEIARQMADALHYIHEHDIIHCDIKTENILLCQNPAGRRRELQIKLLDFGLARRRSGETSQALSGTPHYVAPERIRGEPATPSSDVYGLGILLYEMLTGRVPWDGTVQQILAGHLEQAPTPASSLVPGGLDPALERLLDHALAKHPSQRHRSMEDFQYELRTVMDMLGFGNRRGKAAATKLVPARDPRDQLARAAFDACRLPLAQLDRSGIVRVANPAFARFVLGVVGEVESHSIGGTALAAAWTSYASDIARTLAGNPIRRVIEIDLADGGVRKLLLWLDASGDQQVLVGIHPVDL